MLLWWFEIQLRGFQILQQEELSASIYFYTMVLCGLDEKKSGMQCETNITFHLLKESYSQNFLTYLKDYDAELYCIVCSIADYVSVVGLVDLFVLLYTFGN